MGILPISPRGVPINPHPKIFALIIGTEILNQRRRDRHFAFVADALARRGYTLAGSLVIADDPELIVDTIRFVASQPHSILLSFGGIGSTPDDHTRQCVATALRDGRLTTHPQAKQIIEATLGEEAYPHPIRMAELPQGATLLHNPINNMPAFALEERYFFMPGFPSMSHPMVEAILVQHLPHQSHPYRYTLTAHCKENRLIELMAQMPSTVECSSLPHRDPKGWRVTLSVASQDKAMAQKSFERFERLLKAEGVAYERSQGD